MWQLAKFSHLHAHLSDRYIWVLCEKPEVRDDLQPIDSNTLEVPLDAPLREGRVVRCFVKTNKQLEVEISEIELLPTFAEHIESVNVRDYITGKITNEQIIAMGQT